MNVPVQVIRGLKDGPTVFLSAAIHGDEINGVEIIREVMANISRRKIAGTVIAIPVVNVFGFNTGSRYLPDRRDLNRSFPGNLKGSLASRLAHVFMKEIVSKCTHGIDFHTGAIHRSNYPQIRADLSEKKTIEFAKAFGAPITIDSQMRDGSLREAARKKGVLTLLFEGGQALRFENRVIRIGKLGCLSALKKIGVLPLAKASVSRDGTIIAKGSYWVRSPAGGTFKFKVKLGDFIGQNELIGEISDPFGSYKKPVFSQEKGYIVGINHLPLVTLGEALAHIATLDRTRKKRMSLRDEVVYE
jgi:hypothetical protein